MSDIKSIYFSEFIDGLNKPAYSFRLVFLISLAMLFDGYDTLIVSYTMPQIAAEWNLNSVATGSLPSFTMIGLMIGAFVIGVLSDRFGRRKLLVITVFIYSLLTIPVFFAPNYISFAIFRITAGVGLGSCMPLSQTMISEYSPTKYRSLMVMFCNAFMMIGWIVAGVVSTIVVPSIGWRYVYLIGGLPLIYAFVLQFKLPESVQWLLAKGKPGEAIKIIHRIEKDAGVESRDWKPENIKIPPPQPVVGVKAIVSKNYLRHTIGIWIVVLCCASLSYGITSWMPSLLIKSGLPITESYIFTILQNCGGIVACLLGGTFAEKFGRRKNVFISFTLVAIALIIFSLVSIPSAVLFACIFLGFAANMALVAPMPITIEIYPTEFRATGLACTTVVTRAGGIFAPIIMGVALQGGMSTSHLMLLFLIPICIAMLSAKFIIKKETKGIVIEELGN